MVVCVRRHSVTVLCLAVVFSLDEVTISVTTAATDNKRTIYIPLTDALNYDQTVKVSVNPLV